MFRIVCDPSSGSNELCLTEITRSGSQTFFVCFVGFWQRNFEPAVCVCVCVRYDGLGTTSNFEPAVCVHGTTGWELLVILNQWCVCTVRRVGNY